MADVSLEKVKLLEIAVVLFNREDKMDVLKEIRSAPQNHFGQSMVAIIQNLSSEEIPESVLEVEGVVLIEQVEEENLGDSNAAEKGM